MSEYWFNGDTVIERPENPATITGSGKTIRIENAPKGSQIFAIVDRVEIAVDDREIEVDEPGMFGVRIVSAWPMKESRYDVQIE